MEIDYFLLFQHLITIIYLGGLVNSFKRESDYDKEDLSF